jgi:hypothetical protein
MRIRKLSELVADYSIYPRREIDDYHVSTMVEYLNNGGGPLPPLITCEATSRIVDGFHRRRAYMRISGDDPTFEVECIEKTYKNDAELFLDSMRYNASHGRTLTRFDRTHCIVLAKRLRVSDKDIAKVLHVPPRQIKQMLAARTAVKPGKPQQLMPIKGTIKHKAGQQLTDEQSQCNDKLGGMQQSFYVNQVIMLIENDLVDWENEKLVEKMQRLAELLEQALAGAVK